jgi:hypothetical protein
VATAGCIASRRIESVVIPTKAGIARDRKAAAARRRPALSPDALDLLALSMQQRHQLLEVVAFDFNGAVLDGPARAARGLELLAHRFEVGGRQGRLVHHGHGLAEGV